jgi:hypothetical protein
LEGFVANPDEDARFERIVAGTLRSAIHDHGPISADRIGSAVKRILGALKGESRLDEPQRLLTDRELAEIRAGVREGIRGPVMLKWVEQLLGDHDERVRLELERDGNGQGPDAGTIRE